jgi:hypothetical protein
LANNDKRDSIRCRWHRPALSVVVGDLWRECDMLSEFCRARCSDKSWHEAFFCQSRCSSPRRASHAGLGGFPPLISFVRVWTVVDLARAIYQIILPSRIPSGGRINERTLEL